MTLPKVKHPTFTIELPSTRKNITLRPFTVREEKLLLMAKDSEDGEDTLSTVIQVINNCILDDIDTNKLASFDIEYLLIKLRARSVSETVDLVIPVDEDDKEEKYEVTLNLDEIQVKRDPDHRNKFMITDSIGVIMKYPSIEAINEPDVFKKMMGCIQAVYTDEEVVDSFSTQEMEEFVYSLPSSSIQKIGEFFRTMPRIEHDIEITTKSGEKVTRTLKGLGSFLV